MAKFLCKLGSPTKYEQYPRDAIQCNCDASCEIHIHEDAEYILCIHDGINDHTHCPNNPFKEKEDVHRQSA